MCDKCIQLDKKIERYESLAPGITDQVTLERLRELVRERRPRFTRNNRSKGPSHLPASSSLPIETPPGAG